jgi:hypothetical protein
MSCVTLTKSRKLACTSKIAGVVAIGIAPYDSLDRVVTTGAGVVALPFGAGTIARLELKNTATKYLENGVSGGDNRSTGVTGTIPCTFNVAAGADIADTLMVKELLKGEVVLFIEKKDGTIVVAGSQLGAQAITADGDTGGTIGDLNGYTVTFQTMEPDFSREYLVTGTGLTAYATALMAYV